MSNYERIEIRVKPDGSMEVAANNWAEGASATVIDDLVERVRADGFQARKGNSTVEYTGEVHSQYHHLCGHDHMHAGHHH